MAASTGSNPSSTGLAPFRQRKFWILALLLLSPGIPEYLSGSSSLVGLVINPVVFLIFLGLNLGLYGPGVLLIREAMISWKKGWGTVLLLGAAYGILEEGISLATLFDSKAGPVGSLGFYGHWIGVNWVWTAGILMVHMVYSIALPILLISLALPETRGHSFLGRRGLIVAFGVLALDVFVLLGLIVIHVLQYWYGFPLFLGSFGAIATLVVIARWVPADLLRPRSARPRVGTVVAALTGAALFPGVLVIEGVAQSVAFAPIGAILFVLVWYALLLGVVLTFFGRERNERHLIAFAVGLLVPLMLFGIVSEIRVPIILGVDLFVVWLFLRLFRKYPVATSPPSVPPGVAISG